MWEVEYIDETFGEWWETLSEDDQEKITAAVRQLQLRGPALGRPVVGEVLGSRLHNLKELRPPASSIRILFVFDPRRTAIMLLGADKADYGWKEWYTGAIAEAERIYDDYLDELRKEGLRRMTTRKKFSQLEEQVLARPGAANRVAGWEREIERGVTLSELRRARDMTQVQLARSLETSQGRISQMEKQTDLYLSTLRSYVEALGGQLQLAAVFPDGVVAIETFEELAEDDAEPAAV